MLPKLHARMVEQSHDAAAQGAQFIVWPEGSLSWDPQVEDRLQLGALTRGTSACLAVSYLLFEAERGWPASRRAGRRRWSPRYNWAVGDPH